MRRLLVLVCAFGALLALTACTSGSHTHGVATGAKATTGAAAEPATVRTATCDDWDGAPTDERWKLVRGMRAFFGQQVDSPGARGQVMDDQKAFDLFVSYCKQSFAGEFSLYRIYGNAAAFTLPNN